MITGETVKSAVSRKIREYFTVRQPTLIYPTIYKEKITQNMDKPCFFIWVIDVSQKKIKRNCFEQLSQIEVRFHSNNSDKNVGCLFEELSQKGIELMECLSIIEIVDNEKRQVINSFDMDFKIKDDVLIFNVSYNIQVQQQQPDMPDMAQLKINN